MSTLTGTRSGRFRILPDQNNSCRGHDFEAEWESTTFIVFIPFSLLLMARLNPPYHVDCDADSKCPLSTGYLFPRDVRKSQRGTPPSTIPSQASMTRTSTASFHHQISLRTPPTQITIHSLHRLSIFPLKVTKVNDDNSLPSLYNNRHLCPTPTRINICTL
jgi:hypothetical protein